LVRNRSESYRALAGFIYIAHQDRHSARKRGDEDTMRQIGMVTLAAIAMLAVALPSMALNAKSADELASVCSGLVGRAIDASLIGLPGGGGKIAEAAIATLAAANGERATYCKVMATITPVDPSSFPIEIEINMPTTWNGKAVQ
jgi:hypothetical protein